jgi:hypothetical protein
VTLSDWTSGGVSDVSPAVKAKFKSLGTVRVQGDFARWKKVCAKLPDKLTRFVSGSNQGTMSSASLVVAMQDVPIYRAYSSPTHSKCGIDRPSGPYGGWWSITPLPAGSKRESYRQKMAVCPSWNDFQKKITCTLKKGTVIAVGPTQSMDCKADNHAKESQPGCQAVVAKWKDQFPASGNHQVFLNIYGRDADRAKFLTNCREESWR